MNILPKQQLSIIANRFQKKRRINCSSEYQKGSNSPVICSETNNNSLAVEHFRVISINPEMAQSHFDVSRGSYQETMTTVKRWKNSQINAAFLA